MCVGGKKGVPGRGEGGGCVTLSHSGPLFTVEGSPSSSFSRPFCLTHGHPGTILGSPETSSRGRRSLWGVLVLYLSSGKGVPRFLRNTPVLGVPVTRVPISRPPPPLTSSPGLLVRCRRLGFVRNRSTHPVVLTTVRFEGSEVGPNPCR